VKIKPNCRTIYEILVKAKQDKNYKPICMPSTEKDLERWTAHCHLWRIR